MELSFEDKTYERMERDAGYSNGLPAPVVSLYRSRLQLLRAACSPRDLSAMRCLDFRPLPDRPGQQHAVRLNDEYRLVFELNGRTADGVEQIVVLGVDEGAP